MPTRSTPSSSASPEYQVDQSSEASSPAEAEQESSPQRKQSISEVAVQLQELQLHNSSQSSEIAHLRRQIQLLSEFKGFDVDVGERVRLNQEFWEAGYIGDIVATGAAPQDTMDNSGGDADADGSASNNPNSPEKNDPLAESVNSAGSFAHQLQQTANKYDSYDEAQLKEMAAIVSPKVSELLHEQAMALDDLLDASGWSSSDSDDYSGRKRGKRKARRKKNQGRGGDDDDEDSMNDEWNHLEAAQMDLQSELEAATNGFDQMLDDRNCAYDDNDAGDGYRSYPRNVEGEAREETKNDSYREEWKDSIQQYYADNNHSTENAPNSAPSPARHYKSNHSYSLADHAVTRDVSRPISDRGLYIKPLLSRNELETLGIVTMPDWIARPSGEVSSRGREMYMKRMLDCIVEYIEPPKSKNLRRMYSGWNAGPGERRPDDNVERVTNQGDDSQRVMAYSPAKSPPHEDGDSDEEINDGFEDIDGMAYASSTSSRVMEPLPVRTVTIRIRPDVLCGAVLEALSTSVERVGGQMTKRQGGHLRAVLPGRKMRAWQPGEWERENINQSSVDNGGDDSRDSGEKQDNGEVNDDSGTSNDDAASVVSSLSSMLSLSSPALGTPKRKGPTYEVLPPYIVDAQLVTKKTGKECQRLVLIRIFRMQDVVRARSTIGEDDGEEAFDVIAPLDSTGEVTSGSHQQNGEAAKPGEGRERRVDPLLESKRNLKALQEASALVQRIKAVGGTGFAIDPPQSSEGDAATVTSHTSTKSYLKSFGDAITSPIRYLGGNSSIPPTKSSSEHTTVMELMSSELLRNHASSPSVGTSSKSALAAAKQRSHGIFPSLTQDDSPFVKSSWIFLKAIIEELDHRCLSYSTLGVNPICHFPALPTLDVHFIAQIKAFCRESMIVSLVKTASELEVYAREFEVSCGNVDQLLRPTFDMYKLAPPQLPMPVPLTAYPLDFRPPEEISPPWGPDVIEALERISKDPALGSNGNDKGSSHENEQAPKLLSSFERSEKATAIVVAAFQKQNDVEQGARLGRKNMQVMDRLAKMQAHKRNSIAKIRDSYGRNLLATRAADEFHSLRQKSSNVGSLTDVINAVPDEVPLLMCNVLVGNAAGTCYVTHSHILFNTQLVPILGGSKIHLFSILDVDVTINAPSKSVLSPLPASISFTTAVFGSRRSTREEVYNFIPSIGARRFAKFLEVLRDNLSEDPNSLKFSEKGGLIYLAD